MFRDATSSHPPDPLLANALRLSLAEARSESEEIIEIMREAQVANPHWQGGESIQLNEKMELKFLKPDYYKAMMERVDEACTILAGRIETATTLEEQEQRLMLGMRGILDLGLFSPAGARMANMSISTIRLAFGEYGKAGEKCSRPLLDMKNNLQYYARICYDSIECSSALLRDFPGNKLSAGHYTSTPYGLASLRYAQEHPHSVGKEVPANSDTDLHEDAVDIFRESLGPYLDVLPRPVSADMLGLILRCSEQIANRVYAENGARLDQFRRVQGANDNGPRTTREVVTDPVIRLRTKNILGQLFAQHPDVAGSPEKMAEASLMLEDLLIRDQQLHERGGWQR